MKRISSFWVNLILLAAGVVVTIALINVSLIRTRKTMIRVELETIAEYQIKGKFQSVDFLTVVWDNLIQANGGEVKDFSNRSEKILKDFGGDMIESLQVAPDGVIQYVYPYSFSGVIGTDIEKTGSFSTSAVRCRYTGLDTVSAPEALEDGDFRLVFCHPVYVKDKVGNPGFWGYSIVTARVSQLLSSIQLEEASTRSDLVLYRMDQRNGDQMLMNDTGRTLQNPVRYLFPVPNGILALEGTWMGGWITKEEYLMEAAIGAAVMVLGLLLLMNLRIRKNMKALSRISFTDELTGLNNRHMLRKVFDQLEGETRHISMLFIDFDHFKEINDKEGHDAGDETLKQAAAFFASVFGKDSCFRYGGDEFLVLLQDMPEDEIRRLADRLSEFQVVEFQGRRIPVSVSGGLASADCATVADMRALIRMADDNLYHAKKNGRNQIIGGNV